MPPSIPLYFPERRSRSLAARLLVMASTPAWPLRKRRNRGRLQNRGDHQPVIQISSNPYREQLVPEESKNVVLTYGLMREEQLQGVAAWLFGKDFD